MDGSVGSLGLVEPPLVTAVELEIREWGFRAVLLGVGADWLFESMTSNRIFVIEDSNLASSGL